MKQTLKLISIMIVVLVFVGGLVQAKANDDPYHRCIDEENSAWLIELKGCAFLPTSELGACIDNAYGVHQVQLACCELLNGFTAQKIDYKQQMFDYVGIKHLTRLPVNLRHS